MRDHDACLMHSRQVLVHEFLPHCIEMTGCLVDDRDCRKALQSTGEGQPLPCPPPSETSRSATTVSYAGVQKIQTKDVDTIRELMKKGAFGAGVFQTADCRKTYEEMKAKGVEFVSPPKEQFYGVEAVFKDPFGNWFSMTQPK